jgi:hypothetical protein
MLLTKLIRGLGALSLLHVAVAQDHLLDERTEEHYDPLCWGCPKSTVTRTQTKTYTATSVTTCTVTATQTHK